MVFPWFSHGFPSETPPFSSLQPTDLRDQGTVVRQDEILQLHLHMDPLVVRQGRPDVVRLRHLGMVDGWMELRWNGIYGIYGILWNLEF